MDNAKYIVLDSAIPFLFSDLVTHREVANAIISNVLAGSKVTGAGFAYVNDKGFYVTYGKSVSLNVSSQAEDAAILNKRLGGKEL